MKKWIASLLLLGSSSVFAANLGNVNADCNNPGVVSRTLTGQVGDTFSITVLPTGAICFITSSNSAVVNPNPAALNQNVTQTYTITGSGTTTFSAKQNGNGVDVAITVGGPVGIPTLSEWGVILLMLLLGGVAFHQMRRSSR